MKKVTQRLIAFALAIICTAGFCTIAYAAAIVYNNLELEHIATIENQTIDNITYTAVGGIAAGTNRTSMFVAKAELNHPNSGILATEEKVLFYDYPDITNINNRHTYLIPQAGHANGMAIDDYNIYICGGSGLEEEQRDPNQDLNTYNNWIIKLPRNKFSFFRDKENGYTIEQDDPSTPAVEGYSIVYPFLRSTGEKYTGKLAYITKYNSNKSFIIGFTLPSSTARAELGNNIAFTTANLEIVNNEEKLLINDNPDNIFIVQNNVQYYNGTKQDICYSPGNGLFVPIWYYNSGDTEHPLTNENKNVIMWVDLSTTNNPKLSTITLDGVTYKYYTQPDKINVNQSGNGYTRFEVESIAITDDDEMLFSANIKGSGELTNADSVFKLTHDNGQNFILQ